ncbi:unnamed protein product, partial [Owenia fusiformis]
AIQPTEANKAIEAAKPIEANKPIEAAKPVQHVNPVHVKQVQANRQVDVTTKPFAKNFVRPLLPVDPVVNGGEVHGLRDSQAFHDDEKVQPRVTAMSWDPHLLLKEMYTIKLEDECANDVSSHIINMEGYMEKLPLNKKKATLLKTWKRRFFKAQDGRLHYYENDAGVKEHGEINLMGGQVDGLGGRMIGIDDGRGRYMITRCPTDKEYNEWMISLESQTIDNTHATYVKPVIKSLHHPSKKVLIIDLGSCSIRAGKLGNEPSLPEVFFPTIIAKNKQTGELVCGADAYKPAIRSNSDIIHPIRPSHKVDKKSPSPFNIDMQLMPALFKKVFTELAVNPREYWVLLSAPQNLSTPLMSQLMALLVEEMGVLGVNIVSQFLLSLYSYNATSGILVDVGDRFDIVPIIDGYIIEKGVSRKPYGGARIAEALNSSLTENKYRFFTEVEKLIVRHVMERSCYMAVDYKKEVKNFSMLPGDFKATVDLSQFDIPEGMWSSVSHDVSRFRAPEGLYDVDSWGMDNQGLHKLVNEAINASPMDTRREMCRSIFLSGGGTLYPGFAERLQKEITKLMPESITVQVHASPQRYHSAYIGACVLANLGVFETAAISRKDWFKDGAKLLRKWQNY